MRKNSTNEAEDACIKIELEQILALITVAEREQVLARTSRFRFIVVLGTRIAQLPLGCPRDQRHH